MTSNSGAPRSRALAGALRQAREAAKMSLREVSRKLDVSHSVLSYWENGKRSPRLEDVASYLTAVGTTGDRRERILDLARHADEPGWLTVGLPGISQQLAGTMECERDAETIIDWSPSILPGLLQTSDYARAIIGADGASRSEVESLVLIRAGRRDVLTRPRPVRLVAHVGEAALRDTVGGPAVMLDQLYSLLRYQSSQVVSIHVVQQDLGWHPGLMGPFVLYDFATAPSIVLLEHYRTGAFVYDEADVGSYKIAADRIRELALSQQESAQLIATIADEMGRHYDEYQLAQSNT